MKSDNLMAAVIYIVSILFILIAISEIVNGNTEEFEFYWEGPEPVTTLEFE